MSPVTNLRLIEIASMPTHLLAASVHRNGKRLPVRLVGIGPGPRIVVDSAQLVRGERTRVTIACPLSDAPIEVIAETVRVSGARTWLSVL
jgi:predicted ABC-type transport system involved in lysophospholipase L1 biosynthesis ATPase subunit